MIIQPLNDYMATIQFLEEVFGYSSSHYGQFGVIQASSLMDALFFLWG